MREFPALTDRRNAASPAFDARSLATAVGGELLHAGAAPIRGGAVDSRKVEPGNAFFALPGERADGHNFLGDAAQRGAAALVVGRPPDAAAMSGYADGSTPTVVLVPDVLAALHAAAAAWRARFDPTVVGVTGSIAKTSTKEQVAQVLARRWTVLRNQANENNEIGLPLTLLRLAPTDDVAVLEMGMYTPGDICVLAELAQPRVGVVTAVRPTHLARAGSIDAIERGKRELIDALPVGGTAVLNADDERVTRMADGRKGQLRVLRYGFAAKADVSAIDIESLGEAGMSFVLATRDGETPARIPALGRHSVHNALAAAAVGLALGLDGATIVAGLAQPFSVPHRTTLVGAGDWRILDDTYNAAPDSMAAALDLLASLPGRRVAVLGEMLELSDLSDEAHRTVGEHAARVAQLLVAVGPFASLYAAGARAAGMDATAIVETPDREAALGQLERRLRPGDIVLVKASRGAELDLLVDDLRRLGEHNSATPEHVA
ncbi:MAG: UDP-N-acetylmuramoyl-tripeptide--D-alanyl-D-alanine ligase [Chloroflexota bacterium]|jgi:UDP-N-acetylmuramoyl-tripeptide--D-alanyl-D-alanine ligase|nr:UDP-N-acetylmuramoyl-tripeptide--D-alanyl-D-alanine ligase [Chloroflexota bacterium]